MAEWLCCLPRTIKVLWSNLGATRRRMTLDKSLTAVCLGSPKRCILITCDIHPTLWLVCVYGKLKWLSRGTLRWKGVLSRATANNSCRKNLRLSKLAPNSSPYLKLAERRGILSCFFLIVGTEFQADGCVPTPTPLEKFIQLSEYMCPVTAKMNNILERPIFEELI
jgi:hypothetical protein